jgi:hypothetical protein
MGTLLILMAVAVVAIPVLTEAAVSAVEWWGTETTGVACASD